MALPAGHGEMAARKREACLLVTGQREMRGTELGDAVALLAAILVGRRHELALVNIFVTAAAFRLGDPKHGVLALWNMARFAFHVGMAAFERIIARGVFLDSESRRLEPVHRVAHDTISAAGSSQKLALVIIGMTSRARCVSYRRFEVTASVAFAAGHAVVLPKKRKSCF